MVFLFAVSSSLVLCAEVEPNPKTLRQSISFVLERAAKTPVKKTILPTLLSFPKTSHSPVAYLDAADKKTAPITPKTLIQTQMIALEDGLDGMGRIARAELGVFPSFFYKSTLAYHRKWLAAYRAGKDRSALVKTFRRPGPEDPCVGFTVAMDEAARVFSGREIVASAKRTLGAPAKEIDRPGDTTDQIGSYWAEWEMKDRFILVSQGESSALLLRVIFKP